MRVAVTGAAGDQAAAIATAFVEAGFETIGLTRDAARAAGVARSGATPMVVDDGDPAALSAALAGCDVLAFTSPADYRDGVREAMAARYAAALERAGVRRVVVNTAGSVFPGSGPNSVSLTAVIAAFEGASERVVIEPTIYMDNLAAPWMVDAALSGGTLTYSQPAAARVSWISHRTLGDYAVAAATRAQAGLSVRIGGPAALDGNDLAAELGRALGRALAYVAGSPEVFARHLNASFGVPSGDRIVESIRWLERYPDAMNVPAAGLGVTPEPFATWAKRQTWPSASA